MNKVTFIGGGSFGTALAILLANKGYKPNIWDREEAVVNEINDKRTNSKYIKDVIIPSGVTAFNNIEDAIKDADFVVLTVPSHIIRTVCKNFKEFIPKKAIIVNVAKGIEEGTNLRLSEIIKEELPNNPVVVMSGPTHAEEVAVGLPTTIVVSSEHMDKAELVQELFMCDCFRVYTNDDLIGVEIGGAVKNIIALVAGVSDGIGYGDNSKAALMARGLMEITRIGTALGAKPETFIGLTGMGDLIVTCTSMHSRNRKAGILIGQGYSMDEAVEHVGMVVEGIKACKAFHELKDKMQVSMPITDNLYDILFNGKDPKVAGSELMERDKKHENH